MRTRLALLAAAAAALACAAPARAAGIVPVTASGGSPGAISATVDSFRTSLGPDDGQAPGSQPGGRREVDWDDVTDAQASPALLPGAFYNADSPRGLVLGTPGRGVAVSRSDASGEPLFADVDPSYASTFQAFSGERIFAPMGSTETDVSFRVPGTDTPAAVDGFGAVFSDVDRAGVTTLQLIGTDGSAMGTVDVPPGAFSFAGATGDGIAGVRIITGTAPLAPGTIDDAAHDVVAMDDFVYGEPREPLAVFSLGQATYAAHEHDGSLAVTVRRAGSLAAGTVTASTEAGTATAGSDFTPESGVLDFATGQTTASFVVPLLRDRAGKEGDETFAIVLSAPSAGGVLGDPARATVTLHDDPPPAAAPDRTRPRLSVAGLRRTIRRSRFLRGVGLAVNTNEGCSLEVSLVGSARRATISRVWNLTLGRSRFARARGTRRVRVRPSRRLVGNARHMRVRVQVLAVDKAGNRRTVTRSIRVVRR